MKTGKRSLGQSILVLVAAFFCFVGVVLHGCGGHSNHSSGSEIAVDPRVCGNGIFEEGEECDDGNQFEWDGCTTQCEIVPVLCVDKDGDEYLVPPARLKLVNRGHKHTQHDENCGPIDCDDANAAIHPGAQETLGNGVDENCNGAVSY